ncbi:MAG: hypothetical protein ACTHUU_03275 [Brachybacterium sp.]
MILDCDLLIGRDVSTGRRRSAADIHERLQAAGIAGGAVTSLRAIGHDPGAGNLEAAEAARDHGWTMVCGIDLRNPVDAESRMAAAAAGGIRLVRFAAARQGIPGTAPRLRLLARRATELGLTVLIEGSTRSVGWALMGLGATVIFLDQHFYDAGEFILAAREEPGFHTSTRLLGSPEAWESIAEHVGAERLVLGTRAGWSEELAVLERLRSSGLDETQRDLVASANLQRLTGEKR